MLLGLLSLEGSKSKITMAWLGGVRGVAAVFDGLDGAGQSVGEGHLATVPIANPISRPLRVLPSRTRTSSTSVSPSGRRVRV